MIKTLFSVGAIGLLILRVYRPDYLPSDAVTLGLLIAAVLPWLSSFIETAKLLGGWEVGFRKVVKEQERQREEIESLRFLVNYFVTDYELEHLKKIARGEGFPYVKSAHFTAELRRLATWR